MREQVCIYMCPWPRIQAAMMDEQTHHRRLPRLARRAARQGHRRRARPRPRPRRRPQAAPLAATPPGCPGVGGPIPARRLGDCIDCYACVNVCPMGIDIRDGQQLACITCALCIDACDEVMDKIGKPRGLIGYVTLADGERERAGAAPVPVWRRILRPRVLLYTVLWAGIGVALVAALVLRTDMSISVDPVRNPVNVTLSDGSIRNAYELRLRNMTGYDRDFRLSAAAEAPLALELAGRRRARRSPCPANETLRQRVYLTSAPDSPASADGR